MGESASTLHRKGEVSIGFQKGGKEGKKKCSTVREDSGGVIEDPRLLMSLRRDTRTGVGRNKFYLRRKEDLYKRSGLCLFPTFEKASRKKGGGVRKKASAKGREWRLRISGFNILE